MLSLDGLTGRAAVDERLLLVRLGGGDSRHVCNGN